MLMLSAPNTFLEFWTDEELKNWKKELLWRAKSPEIYTLSVPNLKQVKEEIKNRKK